MTWNVRRALALGAVSLAMLGAAGPAAALTPPAVWAKAGGTPQDAEAALNACVKDSLSIETEGYVPPGIGLVGALIVEGIRDARLDKLRGRFIPRCMHMKGFRGVPLTSSETAEVQRLSAPEKRTAWVERFYARPDFAGRLAASKLPAPLPPPPVAAAGDTLMVYGSLRFEPEKLSAPPGIVAVDGAVLSGTMNHWRTARLQTDVDLPSEKGVVTLTAGTPFQLALLPGAGQTPTAFWCSSPPVRGKLTHTCLRMTGDYYALAPANGEPWFVVNEHASYAEESGDIGPPDVVLIESPDDILGPVRFSVILREVTDKRVRLEAVVRQGDIDETVWKGWLLFNDEGRTDLTLWTHRLVLTRSGQSVTAAYADDGGGAPMIPPNVF
jgi:hypothetical protein